MTVYENLKGMLKDAEEIRDMAKKDGDFGRFEMWSRKVAEHKAELEKYTNA